MANLLFFGVPVGLIIAVNATFYFLTIYNIRKTKRLQKKSTMRRFSKFKLPADQDLKLYIRIAVIMGFTWISGLVLSAFPPHGIITEILSYLFILASGSIGLFIFFAFIFRPEVKYLYFTWFHERMCLNDSSRRRLPSHSIGDYKTQQSKRFAYLHRSTIPSLSFSVDFLPNNPRIKKLDVACEKSNSTLNSNLTNQNESPNKTGNLYPKLSNNSSDSSFKSTESDDVFS